MHKSERMLQEVGQTGSTTLLPENDTKGWSVEISARRRDGARRVPECHILLVEAKSPRMTNLGDRVRKATEMGAQEISNSYGGTERSLPGPLESAAYNRPGVVIAAATGDYGWDWWSGRNPDPEVPEIPASMPTVVSVGGTTLNLDAEGRREREQVWNSFASGASGGGCSVFFASPFWQRYALGFPATGCGDKRLSSDVAADADPRPGMDIFDSYNCGAECERFKKPGTDWSKIGGTSLATPLVSAMYALAGGAQGISYPALTLYAHLGEAAALFDVKEGGNGFCDAGGLACGANSPSEKRSTAKAPRPATPRRATTAPRVSALQAPLAAFVPVPGEEEAAKRRAEEAVAEEARRKAAEEAARREAEEAAKRAAEAATHKPASGQGGTAGFKASVVAAARLHGTRLQAGRGGLVTVKVGCPAGVSACTGTVTVRTLGAVVAGPGAHASVLTLATGRFKIAAGHVTGVRLRLTRRAAALLARRGKLRVRVLIATHGASHSIHSAATLKAFKHP